MVLEFKNKWFNCLGATYLLPPEIREPPPELAPPPMLPPPPPPPKLLKLDVLPPPKLLDAALLRVVVGCGTLTTVRCWFVVVGVVTRWVVFVFCL